MSLIWSITPIMFVMVCIALLKKPAKLVSLLGIHFVDRQPDNAMTSSAIQKTGI